MPEVQEIFQKYGENFREKHKLMPYKLKTMSAIEKCRTEELGYHKDVCDECGYVDRDVVILTTKKLFQCQNHFSNLSKKKISIFHCIFFKIWCII